MLFTPPGPTLDPVNGILTSLVAIGGWIGATELLVAYFLVSKGTLAGNSLRYQFLNLTGSVLLIINCAATGAWPSVIANAFYVAVGVNILLTVKRRYIAEVARRRGTALRQRVLPHHHLARKELTEAA